MSFYLILCCIVFMLSSTYAEYPCVLQNSTGCNFTIICVRLVDNIVIPECDHERKITFIIKETLVNTLTAEFFGPTNFDTHVRVIKGVDNAWDSLDSQVFIYYINTEHIDLSYNKIKNIKDDAFKKLQSLKSLNLSGNAIEQLFPKSLTMTDNKNSQLQILDLSKNSLTNLTFDVLRFMPNLKYLYLYDNKIQYLADDCFNGFTQLIYLNLRNNRLVSLKMSFVNIQTLKNFDVSYNYLKQILEQEVNKLFALEVLNMSHNSIEFIQKGSFSQCVNLKFLDLSHNRIQSSIDTNLFINNLKLTYLNLYNNSISQINDNAFKNNKLNYLNLGLNTIVGEITDSTLAGLENITSLNLYGQQISGIRNNAFDEIVNLVYLNISNNSIKIIESFSFPKTFSLNVLDVSHNNIPNVNFLSTSLDNLTELYLQNNKIIELPIMSLRNKLNIRKIDLSANLIQNIKPNTLPLATLQHLNVSNSQFTGTLFSNVFSPAKSLSSLDLSKSKIAQIENKALIDLPVLVKFNISHNILDYIHPNNFLRADNLLKLDLSYNRLPYFNISIYSLRNLKFLYLNNNKLHNISVGSMLNLQYIDLSHNNIEELKNVPFSKMTGLEMLFISNNKIKVFNSPQINSLTKLKNLSLSANHISKINLNYFSDLEFLDLSHNKFENLYLSFFNKTNRLQYLDLSFNHIFQIMPGLFWNQNLLKFVNLSHNKLENIRYGAFRGLNRTIELDLSHNHIAGIDVDVFYECDELERLIIDSNYLASLDVNRLKEIIPKLNLLSLGGNPLSCKDIVNNIKISHTKNTLEITSIEKVYHEDNVYGIQCGDVLLQMRKNNFAHYSTTNTALIVFTIWGSILTVTIAAVVVIKKHNRRAYTDMSWRFRKSLSSSDFSKDDPNNDFQIHFKKKPNLSLQTAT